MHRDVRVSREAGCRQGPMHRDVRVPLRGRMPKGTAIGRAPRPAPAPHRDVQVSREAGCRKRPALLLPCTAWASCRSRYRGEAESEEGPVDLPPAERAGHGRPAPAFKRSRKAQKVSPFLLGASLRLTPAGLTRKFAPGGFLLDAGRRRTKMSGRTFSEFP